MTRHSMGHYFASYMSMYILVWDMDVASFRVRCFCLERHLLPNKQRFGPVALT